MMRGRLGWGVAVLVCTIFIYSILGFFAVPTIVKTYAQNTIESKFGVKPEIERVSFNPFTFEAIIAGFNLPAKDPHSSRSRLSFESFAVTLDIFPLFHREIRLKSLVLKSVQGQLIIFKNGTTNWIGDKETPGPKLKSEWILSIEHFQIKNSGLDFWDHTHATPLNLALGPFSLTASHISTVIGSETSISSLQISIGNKGLLKIQGVLSPTPFSADFNLEVIEFPLEFLTSYLSDKTVLSLNKGSINLQGNLKFAKANVIFSGDSQIHDFSLEQNELKDPILAWKKMDLKGILVNTASKSIQITEMNVDEPRSVLILKKDGVLNYESFLKTPASSSPKNNIENETVAFQVSKLTISNGVLDYVDQQTRPHFNTHFHNLEGSIGPITSKPLQLVSLDLQGLVDAHGKLKAHGQFTPGPSSHSLDLEMNFDNIDMTIFTPFSVHFTGYEIRKGKLFLNLYYTIARDRFRGRHHVLLDQFALGRKVVPENSSRWPLKLVLALMKDRNEQIIFQLPVSSDAKSSSFSLGNLILTDLNKMILKIAADPFEYLSTRLIGGRYHLQTVLFETGTSSLQKDEASKIENLAKIMEERPELALEIKGEYQDEDIQTLKQRELDRRLEPLLKTHKGDRFTALQILAKSVSNTDELNGFLTNLNLSKGKNKNDLTKDLEKNLLSSVAIPEDELNKLGLARARVVMSWLSTRKLNPQRLSLLTTTKGEENEPPHVTLSIKSE